MLVHIVCGYRSKSDDWTDKWSDEHYRARNLIKAVKKEPFNGFSDWEKKPLSKERYRVENTPAGQRVALGIAAELLKRALIDAGINQADIVPVPSSQHIALGAEFTGSRLASALQTAHAGFTAKPLLRFNSPQPKSHDEGTRNPNLILPHLRCGDLNGLGRVVLLDDVMTSGGHLRAARRFLVGRGINVAGAAVIGRTVWEQPLKMFDMEPERLPD